MPADAILVSHRLCRWCGQPFVKTESTPWACSTLDCYRQCGAWGILGGARADGTKNRNDEWFWLPLPVQAEMMRAVAPARPDNSQSTYVLMGGAAGVSKSHGARMGAYAMALRIPRCRILLLREVSDELKRNHIHGHMDWEVEALGGTFREYPVPMARFSNGSFIEGGHMEDAKAVKRYLSSEYDLIIPEEATQYPPEPLMELVTRARTTNPAMVAIGGARVWLPTNPGGPSTAVLRQLFVERDLDPTEWPKLAEEYRAEEWIHIPGRLDDNPYMDPSYERKLAVLKQAWRYEQLRHGNWWASPGVFFDNFQPSLHVRELDLGSRETRGRLTWFRSLDWGYHDPAVMLWWVVLTDNRLHIVAERRAQYETPEEWAPHIAAMDYELGLPGSSPLAPASSVPTWASPDMWGGRGHVGEYLHETARRCGWPVRQAKTERENGWMRLQTLLRAGPDGTPWLTMEPRCRHLIRFFQEAQSDEKNLDDVRQLNDHAGEAARYGAMSRPLAAAIVKPTPRRTWEDDFEQPRLSALRRLLM